MNFVLFACFLPTSQTAQNSSKILVFSCLDELRYRISIFCKYSCLALLPIPASVWNFLFCNLNLTWFASFEVTKLNFKNIAPQLSTILHEAIRFLKRKRVKLFFPVLELLYL